MVKKESAVQGWPHTDKNRCDSLLPHRIPVQDLISLHVKWE